MYLCDVEATEGNHVCRIFLLFVLVDEKRVIPQDIVPGSHPTSLLADFQELAFLDDGGIFGHVAVPLNLRGRSNE